LLAPRASDELFLDGALAGLLRSGVTSAFADMPNIGARPGQVEQRRVDELVVKDNVRRSQELGRTHRDEAGITGACAQQVHHAGLSSFGIVGRGRVRHASASSWVESLGGVRGSMRQ
jgi:hypothetical protein